MSESRVTSGTACVFCGSSHGTNPEFGASAEALGATLARAGIRLVYGGSSLGLMGRLANSCLANGGEAVGIIPNFLQPLEKPPFTLSELVVTDDMHQRKMEMWRRSDGFLILPGGVGTLEEVLEQLTWVQIGHHSKPIIFINTANYWQRLVDLFNQMREAGFIRPDLEIRYHLADNPAEAVGLFKELVSRKA